MSDNSCSPSHVILVTSNEPRRHLKAYSFSGHQQAVRLDLETWRGLARFFHGVA